MHSFQKVRRSENSEHLVLSSAERTEFEMFSTERCNYVTGVASIQAWLRLVPASILFQRESREDT